MFVVVYAIGIITLEKMLNICISRCLSFTFIPVSEASCFEKELLRDLFKDYDKDMRPVLNDNDTVTVKIGLSLHQIMDVVSNIDSINSSMCCKSVVSQDIPCI